MRIVDRSEPGGGFRTLNVGSASEPGKQTEADCVCFTVHVWKVVPLSQDELIL